MAYSDFTLRDIKEKLGLTLHERESLFAKLAAVECSPHLTETLRYNVPLALAISTEKARSELIVTPVLVELLKLLPQQVSLFSGVEFNIDKSKGLNGICDYLISLSPEQLEVDAPAIAVVEAKNDNIKSGYAQCISEMYAASLYNAAKGLPLQNIHGVVTTGSLWNFLRLHEQTVCIDSDEYHISNVGIILSIFMRIVHSSSQS